MTIWEWIHQYAENALSEGDLDRANLSQFHPEAYAHRQTDPDRMLAILEEGRRQAASLGEPWWVLFFDHWKVETLIYYKDDYRQVIDLSVRQTLELRKPIFEQFPLRFGIYCNLVAAYLCVDPRGYASKIREALDYLGTIVSPDGSDAFLLQARRHWFAYETGDLAGAERLALEELAMCESEPDRHTGLHHEVDTLKALCWISHKQGNRTSLNSYARAGEECARQIGYRYELALFMMWLAYCEQSMGHTAVAKQHCGHSALLMSRLGQPPGESFFDALAGFHEEYGEIDRAWAAREQELRQTQGKGQLAYEAMVRLKRVNLLARMARDVTDEVSAARQAISRLRSPEWYLDQLEAACQGRMQ